MDIIGKIKSFVKGIVIFAVLVFLWLGYSSYDKKNTEEFSFPDFEEPSSFNFECLGKVSCSEMSSCEEAKYYMLNCPNTQLDPDKDGIPCEKSVCEND